MALVSLSPYLPTSSHEQPAAVCRLTFLWLTTLPTSMCKQPFTVYETDLGTCDPCDVRWLQSKMADLCLYWFLFIGHNFMVPPPPFPPHILFFYPTVTVQVCMLAPAVDGLAY